jgi:hypothetical protein
MGYEHYDARLRCRQEKDHALTAKHHAAGLDLTRQSGL